ncbi:hypothetical protein TTHERM_00151650 (macronuclear) [Tetrahymena thermophila SB210]|uniref:Uncharacterized protein n=1 Tax=Tetrahymena thermophila (strain SB210) TaxID=312017 RepID=I7MGH5_TETTS|nr:hypothetical protein TTHERM_00151650 [Tetrahymena thermophila SB210]EAS01452.2 hypothetical protein TTHERM_00151650 [Tetrahymena thermophila SB210]|eukprot:XP_001021698.2 hypothetical protein TTHERM_00151650 [Tetrahymena thermophila SB210]
MGDQNSVLSQSFYLRLQPDRKISISIRYNKKPNGPFLQKDELSMYKQSFDQQIQQRSMSLNKSNLLSRRNSSSASKKNTLQQLLFKQIEQKPKENESINNSNQQLTTPRKNILNLQFKQETNQQINQILSNNKQKNAITKFKSFLINKQKILNKTEVQTSFDDENDILTYDSPLKSKNQTEVSNVMYTSPDVNQITPPRCGTASKQVRRRYSNQLLNSVMKDKNRSYSHQNKIIDCKQISSQQQENTASPYQDIKSANDIDKEFEIENNSQFKESLINQDFIQYFRFFNKKFIEDNLKVSLETDKKMQELNQIESTCSADVMMRIQIPEKSIENLQKYESQWKQHYKVQYRYQDLTQSNKKLPFNQFSQKYNLSQLIYTPYDLFILIEDISVQYTKRAVEFLLLNSYENDRVCLIYVQNDEIYNTPLLNCNQQNKNYLKNIIQNIQCGNLKQEHKVSIFERLKNLIEQRFEVNFLTQAIWFTHGVSLKQTTQITYKYNLIDKKYRFQVSIFEYIDDNLKSFINKLAFQSSGNYYLIPSHSNQSEQIPFVAETLCQIKKTISFKCSGMVRRLTELEYAQYNQNQIKNAILPKMQIIQKYGGQKVWKEDTIFQGNQILIPYLQHDSDYKYYINYQFQLEQQRKYNQIEDQNIPILKVVCLCFLDQIKNSDYIFKQSSLELQFNIKTLNNQISEEPLKNNQDNSADQIIPEQIVEQIEEQSFFQLKYNCISLLSSLTNVKDISYIRNQLSKIQDSFLKSQEQHLKTDQYEVSKILSLLSELNIFAQQSSVHYCNIMIESVVYSLLRSKNPYFQQQ